MAKLGDIDIGGSHWFRNLLIISGLIALVAGGVFYWYKHRTKLPVTIEAQVQMIQEQIVNFQNGLDHVTAVVEQTRKEVKASVKTMVQDVGNYDNAQLVSELERIASLGHDVRSEGADSNGD